MPKVNKSYSEDDVIKAAEAVKNGTTLREAARTSSYHPHKRSGRRIRHRKRQRIPRLDRATGMRSIKWTSQAVYGHQNKSADRLHSNSVRGHKQKNRHNPLARDNPLGRKWCQRGVCETAGRPQQKSFNGQICIAAITRRPLESAAHSTAP